MSQYEPLCVAYLDDKTSSSGHKKDSSLRAWKCIAVVELLVIAIMFLVTFHLSNRCKPPVYHALTKALVQGATKYETRVFHSGQEGDRSPFQGPPSASVEAAWDDLFAGTLFKITKEEELLLPNRTTPIPGDISHYAASLSVVHHLHCINFFRKTLWPEYYGEAYRLRHSGSIMKHHEHCVEQLRQTLMCHPDMTATVIQWDKSQQELHTVLDTQHTCVDYKKIQEWMRARALSETEFDKHVYVPGAPVH